MAAKIAIGELNNNNKPPSGKIKSCKGGAKAKIDKFSKEQCFAIAKKAAEKRWE